MLRAFLTSAFKPDIELDEVKDAEPGYYEIYHPELKTYVTVPADSIDFKEEEDDIGDLL